MTSRTTFIRPLLICFMVFMPFIAAAESNDWVVQKEDNGIKVSTRSVENSNFDEVKAEAIIDSNAVSIFDIVKNASVMPDWIFQLMDAKVVKALSDNSRLTYMAFDMPFPVRNRHYVCENLYGLTDDGYYQYTFDLVDKKVEGQGMNSVHGFVNIYPVNENQSKIIYQFHADPGGLLPGWVANMFLVEGPYETLVSLRKLSIQSS